MANLDNRHVTRHLGGQDALWGLWYVNLEGQGAWMLSIHTGENILGPVLFFSRTDAQRAADKYAEARDGFYTVYPFTDAAWSEDFLNNIFVCQLCYRIAKPINGYFALPNPDHGEGYLKRPKIAVCPRCYAEQTRGQNRPSKAKTPEGRLPPELDPLGVTRS